MITLILLSVLFLVELGIFIMGVVLIKKAQSADGQFMSFLMSSVSGGLLIFTAVTLFKIAVELDHIKF